MTVFESMECVPFSTNQSLYQQLLVTYASNVSMVYGFMFFANCTELPKISI